MEKQKKSKRKWPRRLGIFLLSFVALVILFFASVFFGNKISSKIEAGKIETYGQLVDVDGKKMNVSISGKGSETVVLIPGYGTASPVLDFKPLVQELEKDYQVVVVEPFGYGLSDWSEKPRTTDNIVKELHQALEELGIKKYTLMGHSISGIYGLDYVNKYPDEVTAFVGIDSSYGTQPQDPVETTKQQNELLNSLINSGFYRLLVKVNPSMVISPEGDAAFKKQIKMITLKNILNPDIVSESENFIPNFAQAEKLSYPEKLPVAFYLAQDSVTEDQSWLTDHEKLVEHSQKSEIEVFEGSHYLHHTKAKEIADAYRKFMAE